MQIIIFWCLCFENLHFCCCSVAKLCPTLCNPWNAVFQASLSFISWSLLKFMSIESVILSNHLILCCPLLLFLQSFPASGSFSVSWFSASGGQSIGASASASVHAMNIQDWFPLGLLVWAPCSPRDSRVFFSTTIQKHQFSHAQPSLWSNSHIHTWLLKKIAYSQI